MKIFNNLHGLKKALAITGISLGAIIVLFLLVLFSIHLFTPVVFNRFFSNAQKEYLTPGLSDGLVPQGYTYIEENGIYMQCGYMADNLSASRIYITSSENTKNTYYVELYTSDGHPYTGHTGGITSYGGYVWLANDGEGDDNCVWVLSLEEILGSENGGKITLETKFQPKTRAAYCYADDRYLWVGEFRDGEKYRTAEDHKLDVSGGTNYALICAYPLCDSNPFGISLKTELDEDIGSADNIFIPDMILSVTDLVQGFTRTDDGGFALSTSYSLSRSHLLLYSDVTKKEPDTTLNIHNTDIPVYFLDADVLTYDVTMPPMSEEIFVKDGKIYVLFESACKKYIFGNFTRGRHIYSFDID